MKIKWFLLAALIFLFFNKLDAQSISKQIQQSEIRFGKIGLKQGLSQSTVYTIELDSQGFMWFGTDDGLNRYDGYSITVFKHNDADSNSISDNTILCLLNDKKGNLWIGTRRGGVDRYVLSENKFYHYSYNSKNINTINDNTIHTIYKDKYGYIWFGTNKGLNRFDFSSNTFTRFYLEDTLSNSGIIVDAICEDNEKNLWTGTTKGLFKVNLSNIQVNEKYNRGGFLNMVFYHHIASQPSSLSGDYIHSLYVDRFGTLWVGTYGAGLNRYDSKSDSFSNKFTESSSHAYSKLGKFISSIFEDSRGNLWVSSWNYGLSVLDRNTEKIKRFTSEPVMALNEDRSGIIWLGTYTSGVEIYDPKKNLFKYYYDKSGNPENKSVNLITSILEDKEGELWIGTYNGGLKLYSSLKEGDAGLRRKLKVFKFNPGNPNSINSNKIIALCESNDGSIWIGTENDGLNRYDKKSGKFFHYYNKPNNNNSLSSNQITSLFYDKHEDLLWIGFLNGDVDSYNYSANSFTHYHTEGKKDASSGKNSITTIYKGGQKNLWFGTFDGELYRFIPKSNSIRLFRLARNYRSGLNKYGIYSLYKSSKGPLWVGTYGGGLIRCDISSDSIKSFAEQEGLPDDVVYGILPDKSGNLWLSTNKGISKFNNEKETFRNYDVGDGLQSNEFNLGAYFAAQDGELFFGGVNGFNSFFPDSIKDNTYLPPVYFTKFKVFDKELHLPNALTYTKKIVLSYSQNFFSFEFVALNYTSPEKNRYAYMLEGFDKNWHYVPSSYRYASYTNLDPGKYILHIRGSNNDGVWNNTGASITLIVTPPFWMAWWFRILTAIIIIGIAGSIIRYFVSKKIKERTRKAEQETALEHERLRIARDIHDDLGSRLTEIQLISEMAYKDPERKAAAVLLEVSETARNIISTFSEIVWSVSPQNDTVENLAEYIGQYSVDFLSKAKIKCRLDLPQKFPDWKASSEIRHNTFLAVKEALNNSAKHSETKELHIKVSVNDFVVVVSVHDFGKGFEQNFKQKPGYRSAKFGNGLLNMYKRMEQVGGKCEIESKKDIGTTVKFTVPLLAQD